MTSAARPPFPPFTAETAAQKARLAEDGWNSRDPARVAVSARACAERIAVRAGGRRPAFVVQFDCAGRGKQLFGSRVSESIVEPLRQQLDPGAPWIGFHTFGEIAPVGDRTYYHNLTTALCAVYEDA